MKSIIIIIRTYIHCMENIMHVCEVPVYVCMCKHKCVLHECMYVCVCVDLCLGMCSCKGVCVCVYAWMHV